MGETQIEVCVKCDAEIDPTRRVDFTLKDGTRVCESCIRVPYFGVALQCLPGTDLVLTVTSGMSSVIRGNRELRVVKAPHELHPFHFLMAWHPRLNSDPRHVWLREAMRSTTHALNK
jgi:DNA-binding transcriptional LysR family regulator